MEGSTESYRDLIVWQKATDLAVKIYEITGEFPKGELYGITSQMRRSSFSIPCNIAEGRSRGSRRDYRQFLIIAYGSGAELETQIEIVKRLLFGKDIDFNEAVQILSEVMRMLNKMIKLMK